jgi:hypothetical protein
LLQIELKLGVHDDDPIVRLFRPSAGIIRLFTSLL